MKTNQSTGLNAAAFFKAAANGQTAKLKAMIGDGRKIDCRDATGKTALMWASERGQVEAATVLLKAGAAAAAVVSDRDSMWFGCNAVIFAAQSGCIELVKLLFNAGASPNCAASDGTTPLSLAVEAQSLAMLNALLEAGAQLPKEILVASVWKCPPDISLRLIQAGANVNVCDDLGQSIIHKAAEMGALEVVRSLIRAKAKLNQVANGTSPLLAAIQNGHVECALALIQAGADHRLTGLLRRDALMAAAFNGYLPVVEALLKVGANPNAKDKEGKSALMLANEKENSDVVAVLRKGGSDEAGFAVQEYIRAAIKGDVGCVRDLLDSGVDVNATYPNGAKALISAIMHGHTEVVRLLLDRGALASTTSTAKAWGTSFHADALALAASKGHAEIVQLLIKAGANVNGSWMFGQTALETAAREGHDEVVRLLLEAGCLTKGQSAVDALRTAVRRKKESTAVILVESNVKLRPKDAVSILVSAAERGMLRLVRALVAAGADPKLRNEYDETAVQAAREAGHKTVVAFLEKAKSPQASAGLELIEAAERGNLKTVHRLVIEGVDIESKDSKGATALIRAAATAHLPIVRALLSAGANPNTSTRLAKRDSKRLFHHMELTSETPLLAALSARSWPVIELLLNSGADIRKTECGHVACMMLQEGTKESAVFVERLLDAGMEPDARWPVINVSALEIASQEGFAGLVEKLIRAGARLQTTLERDRTIIDAIGKKRTAIVRMLLQGGISPRVKGPISAEALVNAATLGLDEIVRLLIRRDGKVDRPVDAWFEGGGDAEGVTALMAAACHGWATTVQSLLEAGANPNAEDAVRRTPLDWAQDNKSKNVAQNICRMLRAAGAKGD